MYVLYRALTSPPQREWKHQRILDISQRLQLRNAAPPNFRAACHCLGPPRCFDIYHFRFPNGVTSLSPF